MKVYKNAVQTDRAFIHFDNIQHISWYKEGDIMEVKVYSNGGCIIQRLTVSELDTLLQRYSVYLEVKL
tara:strand:+ start:321 stop:524 length:204 start_codon:yes stop_codon:yes gene_type:complete